jgi:hypothetical protein
LSRAGVPRMVALVTWQWRWLFVGGIALGSISGCTHRVWFTQPIRESFELGVHEADPEGEAGMGAAATTHSPGELQYFLSQRIVLEREVTSRHDELARGRVIARRGRWIERVIVHRGAPGIAVDWGPDWVEISFEKGTRLRFDLVENGAANRPGVNREPAGLFGEELPSSSYRLRTIEDDALGHVVEFDGKRYAPTLGSDAARLKIRKLSWTQKHRTRRVLRGRRVD